MTTYTVQGVSILPALELAGRMLDLAREDPAVITANLTSGADNTFTFTVETADGVEITTEELQTYLRRNQGLQGLLTRISEEYNRVNSNNDSFSSALASAMTSPFHRARFDYSSIGRRIFLVDELPPGAMPVYFSKPDWIKPGVWARTDAGHTVQVVAVTETTVTWMPWRDTFQSEMALEEFARRTVQCDEPSLPPTWFDRLGVD